MHSSYYMYFKAFGVGAFENDDANIYTNYDLSQYDFAIDGSGAASDASCSACSSFSDHLLLFQTTIVHRTKVDISNHL